MNPRSFLVLVSLLCFSLGPAPAQQSTSPQLPPLPQTAPQEDEEMKREQRKLEREQEKKLNQDRYSSLKKDTDKLLQLATELKQNVDKANEHTLALDVVKKAEEIEKLARNVKEKMRGT